MTLAIDNLTIGSVCFGIGGAELAFHGLAEAAFASEIESFPRAVLAHHFPDMTVHGDFTKLIDSDVTCDILAGGTPCQAFSIAGNRQSLEDARGNLSLAFVRLLDAIDERNLAAGRPHAVSLWENVPGVLTVKDNAFGCFLGSLVGADDALKPSSKRNGKWTRAGMVVGPKRSAARRVLDAQYFGLAQRRERVFVVASARPRFDPSAVLLECEGVRRDFAPSREKGTGVTRTSAPSFTASGGEVEEEHVVETVGTLGTVSPGGGWRVGADEAAAGQLVPVAVVFGGNNTSGPIEVSPALNASGTASGRMDFESEAFCVTGPILHALTAQSADASEDGTGRGPPIVPVCFTQNSRSEVRFVDDDGGITGAIASQPGVQQQNYILDPVAFQSTQSGVYLSDTHATLDANNGSRRLNGIIERWAVRRLTPTECERLQGLPNRWTRIPIKRYLKRKITRLRPLDMWDDDTLMAADGPRYKAIGNGWAIPCVRWIAERLVAEIHRSDQSNDDGPRNFYQRYDSVHQRKQD